MKTKTTKKQPEVKVDFKFIVKHCKTIGDLRKLTEEVLK